MKTMFYYLRNISLVLLLIMPLSTLSGHETQSTVKIVSSLPRQGDIKKTTDTFVNAFKMALEEDEVLNDHFHIVYEDWDNSDINGHWDALKEANNAFKAVSDSDVMVYIGPGPSGAAKVSIPILNNADLLMISPTATYPGLTKPGKGTFSEPEIYRPSGKPNFLRLAPTDEIQGAAAARWAHELGLKSAYVISDGDVYGNGLALAFVESAKNLGIEIKNLHSNYDVIDSYTSDFGDLITTIDGFEPDLVFVGINASNNAGLLWKHLRTSSLADRLTLMGGDNLMAPLFLQQAKDAAEGTYITSGGIPLSHYTGTQSTWADKYREKYNEDPSFYAIYAYETMKVALYAIKNAAKKDRSLVRDVAFSINIFSEGAMGQWSFDKNGDVSLNAISVSKVSEGKVEFIKELN